MMTAAQKATGTNAFKVGDKVHWHISTDDGRGGGEYRVVNGTVVKVGRTKVQVETLKGNLIVKYAAELKPGHGEDKPEIQVWER
jgi:hypothetical protein